MSTPVLVVITVTTLAILGMVGAAAYILSRMIDDFFKEFLQ